MTTAKKWLQKYYDLGGTAKGLVSSIRLAHPLGSIARKDWDEFSQSLKPQERAMLAQAIPWYKSTYGDLPDSDEELQEAIDKAMSGERGQAKPSQAKPRKGLGRPNLRSKGSSRRFEEFVPPQ